MEPQIQKIIKTKIHFNLRQNKKNDEPTIIYCVFSVDGKQYKVSTNVKVKPNQWCKQKELTIISNIQSKQDNHNNKIANEIISHFKFVFHETFLYICNIQGNNFAKEFRTRINNKNNKNSMDNKDIIQWLLQSIERKDKKVKSNGTKKQYTISVRWLDRYLDYLDSKGTIITEMKDIAKLSFFNKYREWLIDNLLDRQGEKVNLATIQKNVNTIHTLLKCAVTDELITRTMWQDCKLQPLVDDTAKDNQPFLTNDEVMAIYNYKTKNKTEEKVKDLFLLECTCGQRFGDIPDLGKCVQYIGNEMVIDCITAKENKRVYCNIVFDIAREILEKYNFDLPFVESTKYNQTIKEIAKKCGLTRKWKKSIMKGNNAKTTITEGELWQFIHSHTARHTFDTLLLMRGWSYNDIAKYSGHTEEMVRSYTRACVGAFFTQFKQQQRDTPNLIVKTIEEVRKAQEDHAITSTPEIVAIRPIIKEYKEVLTILGVNPIDWFDVNDIDELHRMICNEEHSLLEKYKIDYHTVKKIYNSKNLSLKDKAVALAMLKKSFHAKQAL